MRTTLTLDDDVFAIATDLARRSRSSLGTVLSDLARKGLTRPVSVSMEGEWPSFRLPEGSAVVTTEQVKAALDDEDQG